MCRKGFFIYGVQQLEIQLRALSLPQAFCNNSRAFASASCGERDSAPAISHSCFHSSGVSRTENDTMSSNLSSGRRACFAMVSMAFCYSFGIVLPELNHPFTVVTHTPSNEASSGRRIPANSTADLRRWFTSFISHIVPKSRIYDQNETDSSHKS